jgi:hypothetical protein
MNVYDGERMADARWMLPGRRAWLGHQPAPRTSPSAADEPMTVGRAQHLPHPRATNAPPKRSIRISAAAARGWHRRPHHRGRRLCGAGRRALKFRNAYAHGCRYRRRPASLSPTAGAAEATRVTGKTRGRYRHAGPAEIRCAAQAHASQRDPSAFLTVQEGCDKFCTYLRGALHARGRRFRAASMRS